MNKLLILNCLLIITSLTFSQIKIPVASKSDISIFLKNKTYVVLKNDRMSDYNEALKEAINTHWDITEFEFIYESDFGKFRKDKDKSFLLINQIYFEKDKSQTLFDFLILTNGGNFKTIDDMPTICAPPQ